MREPLSFRVFRVVVLFLLALFVLVPLWVMVTGAIKPLGDVQGEFEWWPSHPTLQPFKDIWQTVPLAKYFTNSLIVCTVATVFSVLIAILAGYAVSRWRFRGRSLFTGTILSTQMFPGILFLLPLFLIFVNLDKVLGTTVFYQTRLGLIVTYLTFTLPFSIWMLAGYFDGIPRELDEAAKVDGAGTMRTLWQVILPAARPGVIAVAVYAFMTSWGEILFASQMTNTDTQTLSIGLQSYSTSINVYWNQVMAASLVVSVPIVVVFLLLQRYLVAGLTSGAVK
ncbi:carbohydrate ABC transporter membrane protein 2 (CUT1 family) [Branchiibius hedensis]|uniref:Carbohydrate ABC transporter membrane protein 2, CUT1 family n=1 Tax=Branchiibius hedensis TaxID=672460 RepID=A0A2Y8ZXW2_9MICO|nr:carbohydrate ABC transporter permease [Branchiibius hedensis]PWJ25914.1 carbohydrate ABC transporter membrane protein 2 (CUT1 family) [Branchiibius hedensis]SSA34727.1 carbohydrate ABC transporter membrane protein 2, CUT1 family [Branchiibius hedensis]